MRHNFILFFLVFSSLQPVFASDYELAKAAQTPLGRNPEAKYYTLPLLNSFNGGYGANNNFQYYADTKPVIPLGLTQDYDLILRPILYYYHQPNSATEGGYVNGIGDFNPTAFISPFYCKRELDWGIGPTLFIPTASNEQLGSGKWSLGPQLALIVMPQEWVLGLLTSNIWSFAGNKNRSNVNEFSFQYFISYNFRHGWYLTSQPTITSNWKAVSNARWTIPFGAGLGRAFHYKGQALNFLLEGYYNAVSPENIGPTQVLQFNAEWLFRARVNKNKSQG